MKTNSLKFNIFYNILYQLLIVIIPLITSPYISRVLGTEMTGIYAYTYSIASYFMMFGRLGIFTYGSRCIAQVRDNKEKLSNVFWSLIFFQLFFSFIVIIFYIIFTYAIASDNKLIYLLQLTAIFANMLDITWFFNGMEEFKITITRNFVIKIITLVLIFCFVKDKFDLWVYTLIMGGGTLLGQISMWPYLRNRVTFKRPTFSEIMSHLKPNLILFIPSIAMSIFTIMDKIMLGAISEMTDVGYYEYAEKIISIPKTVIAALGTAMLPRMTNLIANGKEKESNQYIRNTMFYVSVISSALVFGLMSVANVFAPVYWGKEYIRSGYLIIALCPSITLSVIGNVVRTQYLIPKTKDKEYIISLILGALFNLVGNIIMIPKLGALGASISTVIAEFVITSVEIYVSRKELAFKQYLKDGYKYFLIGIIMFTINFYISQRLDLTVLNLLFLIFLGALIYITLFVIIILLSKSEIEMKIKLSLSKKFKFLNKFV